MQDAPVDTYVVCLDCGKQFEYDLKTMRLGKVINASPVSKVKKFVAVPAARD